MKCFPLLPSEGPGLPEPGRAGPTRAGQQAATCAVGWPSRDGRRSLRSLRSHRQLNAQLPTPPHTSYLLILKVKKRRPVYNEAAMPAFRCITEAQRGCPISVFPNSSWRRIFNAGNVREIHAGSRVIKTTKNQPSK